MNPSEVVIEIKKEPVDPDEAAPVSFGGRSGFEQGDGTILFNLLLFSNLSLTLLGSPKFVWEDYVCICFHLPRHVGRRIPASGDFVFCFQKMKVVMQGAFQGYR